MPTLPGLTLSPAPVPFRLQVTPHFGGMLADRVFDMWQAMRPALPRKHLFHVIEVGGGTGQLAADFMLRLEQRRSLPDGLFERVRYTIGERSPALQARQQARNARYVAMGKLRVRDADARNASSLLALRRHCLEWEHGASAANESAKLYGVLLSNELVDAFEFSRVRVSAARCARRAAHA